jgi:hypothetical protein
MARRYSRKQRGRSEGDASSGPLLPLTSRAKSVLQLAAEEAQRLNHSYVGMEHLLPGLLAEGNGVAAGVLFESGVNLTRARAEVYGVAVLLTNANFFESGDHDGTLIVPWPP